MTVYRTYPPTLTRTVVGSNLASDDISNPNNYFIRVEAAGDADGNKLGGRWDGYKDYVGNAQSGYHKLDAFGVANSDHVVMANGGHMPMVAIGSPQGTVPPIEAYYDDLIGGRSYSTTIPTSYASLDSARKAVYDMFTRFHANINWGGNVSATATVPGSGGTPVPGRSWGGKVPDYMWFLHRQEPDNDATPGSAAANALGIKWCLSYIEIIKVYQLWLSDNPHEIKRVYFGAGMAATGSTATFDHYLAYIGINPANGAHQDWYMKDWFDAFGADLYIPYAVPNKDTSSPPLVTNPVVIGSEQSFGQYTGSGKLSAFLGWVDSNLGTDMPIIWPEIGIRYVQQTDAHGKATLASPLDTSDASGDPLYRYAYLNGPVSTAMFGYSAALSASPKRSSIPGTPSPVASHYQGAFQWLTGTDGQLASGANAGRPRMLAMYGFNPVNASTLTYDPLMDTNSGPNGSSHNGEGRDGHYAWSGLLAKLRALDAGTVGPPTGLSATTPTAAAPTSTLTWQNATGAVDVVAEVSWSSATPKATPDRVITIPHNADGTITTTWTPASAVGTTRTYKLRSKDAVGNLSATGPYVAVVYPAAASDVTPPSVPAGLGVAATIDGGVATWPDSTDTATGGVPASGLAGYDVALDGATFAYVPGTAPMTTSPSWTFRNLSAASAHSYQVRAIDNAGNPSAWSVALNWTTLSSVADTASPTAPPNPRLNAVSANGVTIITDPATDDVAVTGYGWTLNGIRQSPDVAPSATPTFSAVGLFAATAYTAVLWAYDAAGNNRDGSVTSTTFQFRTNSSDPGAAPVARLAVTPATGPAPLNVTASLAGSTGIHGEYDYDDGTAWEGGPTAGALAAVHVFTAPGVYQVRARVYNAQNVVSDWAQQTVRVEWQGGMLTAIGIPLALPGETMTATTWNRIADAITAAVQQDRIRLTALESDIPLSTVIYDTTIPGWPSRPLTDGPVLWIGPSVPTDGMLLNDLFIADV